jgi:hypothetical protein
MFLALTNTCSRKTRVRVLFDEVTTVRSCICQTYIDLPMIRQPPNNGLTYLQTDLVLGTINLKSALEIA